MPSDVRAIKNRIRSIESTLHITKAMQLVASSKIKRAALAYHNSKEYAESYKKAYAPIVSGASSGSVYLSDRTDLPDCYIVICADRGLAGGYNGNIFRYTADIISEKDYVLPIGKRSVDYYKKRYSNILSDKYTTSEKISDQEISEITSFLINDFKNAKFGRIFVVYTRFESIISQITALEAVLPISVENTHADADVIYEPDPISVMNYAIKGYMNSIICSCIRESYLSELYSRRNAMDSATENAEKMIEEQNLIFNRARQSNITQEITEIVAGAEDR